MRINLNSVNDIKDFVNTVSKFQERIIVASSEYMINAKSIMGLFSLDLSNSVEVTADSNSNNIYSALQKYAA